VGLPGARSRFQETGEVALPAPSCGQACGWDRNGRASSGGELKPQFEYGRREERES
jgi:hypothetical protein